MNLDPGIVMLLDLAMGAQTESVKRALGMMVDYAEHHGKINHSFNPLTTAGEASHMLNPMVRLITHLTL